MPASGAQTITNSYEGETAVTIYQRTEKDAKRAAKAARKGMKLYVLLDVAQNIAPYEDAQLYSKYEVTHQQAFTGAWMICGSLSVEGLVLRYGPVYTEKPKGIRDIATPGRQVAGPNQKKIAEKAGWGRRAKKPAKAGRR